MLASSLGTRLIGKRVIGTLFLGAAFLGASITDADVAAAAAAPSTCIFAPLLVHRVDAALEQKDALPPGTPVVLAVDAFRRAGMTCTRASCVSNSCGDTGTVRIELAPSADDNTPPSELGYRLQLVGGKLPASMLGVIGVTLAAGQTLFLRASFEEMTALDASLVAVAVDGAGNESAPTQPFGVHFDGCTLAAVGDRCEDELDPDTDLAGVWNGEGDAELPGDGSEVGAGVSCSFAGLDRARPAGGVGVASLALLLVAGWARRRKSCLSRGPGADARWG
jgi:hypothetical protein